MSHKKTKNERLELEDGRKQMTSTRSLTFQVKGAGMKQIPPHNLHEDGNIDAMLFLFGLLSELQLYSNINHIHCPNLLLSGLP